MKRVNEFYWLPQCYTPYPPRLGSEGTSHSDYRPATILSTFATCRLASIHKFGQHFIKLQSREPVGLTLCRRQKLW